MTSSQHDPTSSQVTLRPAHSARSRHSWERGRPVRKAWTGLVPGKCGHWWCSWDSLWYWDGREMALTQGDNVDADLRRGHHSQAGNAECESGRRHVLAHSTGRDTIGYSCVSISNLWSKVSARSSIRSAKLRLYITATGTTGEATGAKSTSIDSLKRGRRRAPLGIARMTPTPVMQPGLQPELGYGRQQPAAVRDRPDPRHSSSQQPDRLGGVGCHRMMSGNSADTRPTTTVGSSAKMTKRPRARWTMPRPRTQTRRNWWSNSENLFRQPGPD